MTIVITGAKGRLGSEFIRRGFAPMDCDISIREEVIQAIDLLEPRTIINCAAYTDVDGAENPDELDKVMRANVRGPGVLRQVFDGYLIHISTAYVFDGKSGPYTEEDIPQPINWYGWSKLGGEAAVTIKEITLIIRTLDLFGPDTTNDFARQIRDVLSLDQPYALPTNLFGSPTYIPHLAEAILAAENIGLAGILNVTGDQVLSRYKWGRMIAEAFGHDPQLIEPTDEIKGKAPRPLRGGLLVERAKSLAIPIYSPEDGLRELAEMDDDD